MVQITGSNGLTANVNDKGELETSSISTSVQQIASQRDKQTYQVSAELAISTSSQNILLLKNTSNTKDMVITYIRVHTIGAAPINSTAFFAILLADGSGDYASGGTAITPTNLYSGSANTADGVFYNSSGSAIVTSGTYTQIDKTHEVEQDIVYRKEGSIVIPKGQSLLITHIGSTVAGSAYARVSFFYGDPR